MSDIFISYKREEQAEAKKLADALQKKGWSVWWDPKLRVGEHFNEAIGKALNESTCVIVIWSKLSVQSRKVRDEANYALDRNKLLPIEIEKVDLPFPFEGIQTAQLFNWDGSDSFPGYQKLIVDIESILCVPPVGLEERKLKEEVKLEEEKELERKDAEIKYKLKEELKLKLQPKAYELPPIFNKYRIFDRNYFEDLHPKKLEWEQKQIKWRQKENERKQIAREANPLFYQRISWWISMVLCFGVCIGLAFIIVPLVEWSLVEVLGWFSLALDNAALVDHQILAVALSGIVWATIYSIVAVAHYADDPALGWKAFFLHGLLGGWVNWFEGFEGVAAFPLNMIMTWVLSRFAAWVSFYFLGVSPDIVAYLVLGGVTVLGAAAYLTESLVDLDL